MDFDAEKSALTVVLSLLILLTLLGNGAVLIVLLKTRSLLKKPLYVFICNICLADVLATLLTMTFEVSEELTNEWKFGEIACKVIEYLEMTLFGVNIFTHFSIAIERYNNVVHPFKPRMTRRTTKILIAVSWSFPAFVSLPYLYTLRLMEQTNGQKLCVTVTMPWAWLDKIFLSVELLAVFLIPLVCIIWMYTVVVWTLHKMQREENTQRVTIRAATTHGSRVSIAVVCVFGLCWLPFVVVYSVRLFTNSASVNRTNPMYVTALYSSYVSELLTPFLYCAFDHNIRPVLLETIRCPTRPIAPSKHSTLRDTGLVRSNKGNATLHRIETQSSYAYVIESTASVR